MLSLTSLLFFFFFIVTFLQRALCLFSLLYLPQKQHFKLKGSRVFLSCNKLSRSVGSEFCTSNQYLHLQMINRSYRKLIFCAIYVLQQCRQGSAEPGAPSYEPLRGHTVCFDSPHCLFLPKGPYCGVAYMDAGKTTRDLTAVSETICEINSSSQGKSTHGRFIGDGEKRRRLSEQGLGALPRLPRARSTCGPLGCPFPSWSCCCCPRDGFPAELSLPATKLSFLRTAMQ